MNIKFFILFLFYENLVSNPKPLCPSRLPTVFKINFKTISAKISSNKNGDFKIYFVEE